MLIGASTTSTTTVESLNTKIPAKAAISTSAEVTSRARRFAANSPIDSASPNPGRGDARECQMRQLVARQLRDDLAEYDDEDRRGQQHSRGGGERAERAAQLVTDPDRQIDDVDARQCLRHRQTEQETVFAQPAFAGDEMQSHPRAQPAAKTCQADIGEGAGELEQRGRGSERRVHRARLEHDPEKWEPVFG